MLEALSRAVRTSLSLSAGGTDEDEARSARVARHEAPVLGLGGPRLCSRRASRALDERERRILLRFFDGLTQDQIAQQVGISQMHVSRLIRRALEKIREEIASDELEAPGAKRATG